jgi:NAD(P)-dependent dehydrogenase (short-subunit alcohol dehydrogenase family)
MRMSFANRVILITGGASGVGRELALQLARKGAKIGIIDRNALMLESLGEALPDSALVDADVTDRAGLEAGLKKVRQQLGPIDILIASAGLGFETSALNFHAGEFERLIDVNLTGVANSVAAVLPEMLERRQGHIVGISSLASFRGLPLLLGYCASKAGLNALLDGLRVELKPHGIAVTTICPGWIFTPMTADTGIPREEMMSAAYVASQIIKAIRRRRRFLAFPPGMVWRLRLLAWLPFGLGDQLTAVQCKQMLKRRSELKSESIYGTSPPF